MAYEDLILAAATKYEVDPDLVRKVMRVESGGRADALSPKGAIGPMQLMPGTAKDLNVNPFDPAQNIDGGVRYLAQQVKRFGPEGGLAAYNGGPGRFERVGRNISRMPQESQNYVGKVMGSTSIPGNASPGQGGYDSEDPTAVYKWLMENSPNVPAQQLTPEQQEMMMGNRRQRASMLPMSIGAALSGDKRMNALGMAMYKDANTAGGPMEMDGGYMLPNGQIVENPLATSTREEKRQDRALSLALQASQNASNRRMSNDLRLLTLSGQQARHLDSQNKPPSGYRWADPNNPDAGLEAIQGGPGDPKVKAAGNPSEDERKAAGYMNRIQLGQDTLGAITSKNPDAAKQSLLQRGVSMLPVFGEELSNVAASTDRQRVEAAQLDMLDAALTLNTGAAYTREQLKGLTKSYFPQIGDDPATIQDKTARLDALIETARLRAGRAAPQGQAPAPQAAQPQAGGLSADELAELENLRKQFGGR
jgi:hypothetical protein